MGPEEGLGGASPSWPARTPDEGGFGYRVLLANDRSVYIEVQGRAAVGLDE
jgi:hypothetical protein